MRYAAHFTKEKALLAKQKYTSKGGESGNWAGGTSPEGTQSSLFTYTLGDKVVDGWSHYQVGTRALGGVNLVGGVLGVGVGLGLGGVSCETGVGCFAATMLLTYSTDHAYAGARTLWSGRLTPTLLQSALIEAGLSPNTVAYVDGALGLLTGVGTLSPATLRLPLREIGVIRDAEEVGHVPVHGEGGMVRGVTGDGAARLKEPYRPNWQGEGVIANKLPASSFDEIAASAARNSNSDRLMLGKYLEDGKSYTKVASHYEATYLKLDNWRDLTKTMSQDDIWKINESFLRQQIKQDKQIILSHDPSRATGFYAREVDYLEALGYKFTQYNWVWKATR